MLSIDQQGCAALLLHGSHRVQRQGGLAAALGPKHLQEQAHLLKRPARGPAEVSCKRLQDRQTSESYVWRNTQGRVQQR